MASPVAETERELLEGCRAGVRAAVEGLVRLHQESVSRFVLRLVGNPATAEEIVQETFLRVLSNVERIDPARGARAWIFRVAMNLARDRASHGHRFDARVDAEALLSAMPEPSADPERRMLEAERWERFGRAFAELTAPHREVILLRYGEGMSFREIAEIARVPETVLRVRAARARTRLAVRMRREEDA